MFINYLKIAWRSIKREKLFAFIKIGGFAMGIAACLLIALFIFDELSYDKHYNNKNSIYRVVLNLNIDSKKYKNVYFPLVLSETLQADYPEIKKAGKAYTNELFGAGKKGFRKSGVTQNNFEEGFIYGDQELLEILEIPIKQGNPQEALLHPHSMVISETKALKYFPNGNAIGQTIILDNNTSTPYTITAVMKDSPKNAHLNFDFLLPIEDTNMSWTRQNYITYILVDDRANIEELEKKMFSIIKNYVIPAQRERGRDTAYMSVLENVHYTLQPITDIHLKSDISMEDGLKHGDMGFIWLFAAIAGFILLLAAINFINLSTAKSANRAKEVGLRKTIGAYRSNLVAQFLTESILFSFLSFLLGILLAWVFLPYFNSIAAKSLSIPWGSWVFVTTILLSALFIGFIAGLYPAFYLSAFKPINVLKGSLSTGGESGKFRAGLVIFQFTISVILIIGTLIINRQMKFIMQTDLGYEKEQLVILGGAGILGNKTESFKSQLLQLPQVQDVTVGDYLPIEGTSRNGNTFKKVGIGMEEAGIFGQIWHVDYDYIKTLGIQLKKGRYFSKEFASDSINSIVINSKMADALGYNNPIGETINNNYKDWTIIGVVDNFHFKSLREEITPLTLTINPNNIGTITIKLNEKDIKKSLELIGSIWNTNVPNQEFSYSFMDQQFARMHANIERMSKIINSFALFAIFVACLGLYALSAFMVEQRKKEISIRIVLGAPFKSIYNLLTMDFMKLILISIVIAVPIGWYIMSRWLEDFAYRIHIGWAIFLEAGVIALFIALVTISYQSVSSALIQPYKGLRTE